MIRRSTLQYSLAAALTAGAIAATPAPARPIDKPIDRSDNPTSSLAGTTSRPQGQDLRGEHARDAERLSLQDGQPVFPTYHEPLPRPEPVNLATTNDDGDGPAVWILVAGGLAGAGVVAGGAAGVARRYRVRARRVAV